MRYNTDKIRRQDRVLSKERAMELIKVAEYGVLSLCGKDGIPYGIPVNHIYDGEKSLYIHCAPEGRKLEILKENEDVSFCIVGRVNLLAEKFTTEYESVILKAKAHINLSENEKRKALTLLIDKFSPQYKETGLKYMEKSFHRTEIIRLDIEEFSGKAKYVAPLSKN
ncbi:MAG: pyridoxamine 5'-phosphate oxidase family protein [Bacteroidales bacterium]|nr:pyridoxamine 5'-phosphate oxidase family protein [Bacteroidales bacterium]